MVEHAKLPNLVIVAVLGLTYFWRKIKPFDHWKEDAAMKFNLSGSIK